MSEPTTYDAAYYAGNRQSEDRVALWWYARVARRLADPGARALDFGCGVGHFSRRLATRYESWATDLSPHARAQTALTSPTTRVVADDADLPTDHFDLLCTLHVLEHIPEPFALLERFAGWLKPGGRLLYVVPDVEGYGHRRKGSDWFAYRDDTHCSLLATSEWLALTEAAGFALEKVRADGLWDPPYVPGLPRPLQLGLFGAPAAIQVALGRLVLPRHWGECIVVVARKRA